LKKKLFNKDFYFITDSKLSKNGIISDVKNAIFTGCKFIQYREKDISTIEMINIALKLKKITYGKAKLIINDRVDVALASNADGVHIGNDDMPYKIARKILGKDKIIGQTIHNFKEALIAKMLGVDYIGVGPIFSTKTKTNAGKPCGVKLISEIKSKIDIPIVAIGGINKKNAKLVMKSRADSVVSISAIYNSKNFKNEIKEFISIIKSC
jgi:thiamine-phosphate pyrophosphorylase